MPNFILKTIDIKTVSVDFPSTGARKSSDIIVPFSGITLDDFVAIDGKFPVNADFTAWVSGVNFITIRFNNYTASTLNLNPFDIRILVLRKDLESAPISSSNIQLIQVSGDRILGLTDANKFLNVVNSSVITIPVDSNVNFLPGTVILVNLSGIGEVSFTVQPNVILQSFQNARKLSGPFTQAYLIKLGSNTWQLSGQIKN
jgi:hypothetical protein